MFEYIAERNPLFMTRGLIGFTNVSDNLDPLFISLILATFFRNMFATVDRCRSTVNVQNQVVN